MAGTTDGEPPDTWAMCNQAKGHKGFIVCGFPATFENRESEAPMAFPAQKLPLAKIGYLMRISPRGQTANLAKATDERMAWATCALMGIEELPERQKS